MIIFSSKIKHHFDKNNKIINNDLKSVIFRTQSQTTVIFYILQICFPFKFPILKKAEEMIWRKSR